MIGLGIAKHKKYSRELVQLKNTYMNIKVYKDWPKHLFKIKKVYPKHTHAQNFCLNAKVYKESPGYMENFWLSSKNVYIVWPS